MECAISINGSTSVAVLNSFERQSRRHADADGDLVAALREGDEAAAETLFGRYGDRAYRLAFGITRTAEDAEEVVQDAFWRVVRKIGTFRGESALGSWVYRIVANAAYERLRSRARHRDEISLSEVLPAFEADGRYAEPIADWSARIDDRAVQVEVRAALNAAIGELPATYRALIILRDFEGLSMAEAAEAVGITVTAAKTRSYRARLFLRKRLAALFSDETQGTTTEPSRGRAG